ncbi:hypothetical protein NQ317_010625 [Molorchus minor]|uniref:RRM domain-containing protein n=1 Tax=Molorchus minor TaxID=1323400 RepID=A0ABQ9JC37_9CUCU|nr:hypothetical protein NQ317_010625 [Molorchus minor]
MIKIIWAVRKTDKMKRQPWPQLQQKNPDNVTAAVENYNKANAKDKSQTMTVTFMLSKIVNQIPRPIMTPKNVHYEGDVAIYTDPKTHTEYQWDGIKNEWILRNNVVYGFEDDTHVYTDNDGAKYFWDKEKNAWFPKVDDDFMARYQMSYGFTDPTKIEVQRPQEPVPPPEKRLIKKKGEKRKASDPTWFEINENQNTNVYVSHLPLDIEEQEFVDLMQKCGLEHGTDLLKGDGLCTYIRIESVDLALKLLDGYEFNGHKIKVERAKFQLKGEYDPETETKNEKEERQTKVEETARKAVRLATREENWRQSQAQKVVIVSNLFDPTIFDTDVSLILEFQQDLREECSKLGEVRKVIIYDRHPDGVAQINMGSPEEADQVVELLNGRWFMKRQLSAEIWNGRTKFKIAETDSEISERLNKWDKFLEGEEEVQKKVENDKGEIVE